MPHVVEFFDPRPLRGIYVAALAGSAWTCPDLRETGRECVELVDVNLTPVGVLVLELQAGNEILTEAGVDAVLDADDGSLALALASGRFLAFPARERERVTSLFLKLANRQY